MDKELFDKLVESVRQMGAIRRGELKPGAVFTLVGQSEIDLKAGRTVSQEEAFARASSAWRRANRIRASQATCIARSCSRLA